MFVVERYLASRSSSTFENEIRDRILDSLVPNDSTISLNAEHIYDTSHGIVFVFHLMWMWFIFNKFNTCQVGMGYVTFGSTCTLPDPRRPKCSASKLVTSEPIINQKPHLTWFSCLHHVSEVLGSIIDCVPDSIFTGLTLRYLGRGRPGPGPCTAYFKIQQSSIL